MNWPSIINQYDIIMPVELMKWFRYLRLTYIVGRMSCRGKFGPNYVGHDWNLFCFGYLSESLFLLTNGPQLPITPQPYQIKSVMHSIPAWRENIFLTVRIVILNFRKHNAFSQNYYDGCKARFGAIFKSRGYMSCKAYRPVCSVLCVVG